MHQMHKELNHNFDGLHSFSDRKLIDQQALRLCSPKRHSIQLS